MGLFSKMFGSRSDRELKRIEPIVQAAEALEAQYAALTNDALRAKTDEFRRRLADGETLDDLLPEALATVREGAWRVIGQKAFHVQLLGAVVLHQGRIAEMKTGEGKTLTATLCAYVNGLTGEGVHIVTVNDYLAKRDSEWMGKVNRFLGLTVGLVIHGTDGAARRAAYAADITYGTNNEMGFDYLRDNMAIYAQEMVQRGHAFAIVDEVDSILIDEARTPLIISGQGEESTQLYQIADAFAAGLRAKVVASVDTKEEEDESLDADYVVDEKARTVTLTARGVAKAEKQFALENLSDPENATVSHHINQAIRARGLMKRDIDYVVKDGEVIIVDEFTGRLMFGRRYSEGLHQAIEAKERVTVARESKTLATITFQNYFRLYRKLSGMTGTAMTEEEEFGHTYKLDIVEIPTNRPMVRDDRPDVVYKREAGKYRAIVRQIQECHEKGQPVLVGTISIEKSELISKLLTKQGIRHNVLNAKFHEKEAEIVAQAGQTGAVTVATNMAGRGTDIMLGGNAEYLAKAELRRLGFTEEVIAEATGFADTDDETVLDARARYAEAEKKHRPVTDAEAEKVRAAGGLFILGTERHESRRIDNQIRGRAGRQGDPGESRFFLSLEDDIMRLFGSERVMGMMETLGVDDDTPIDAKILSGAIESAQKRVESRNFQSRKSVLEYDDVMNVQRKVIYEQRRKVLDGEDMRGAVENMIVSTIENDVNASFGEQQHLAPEAWRAVRARYEGVFLRQGELDMGAAELETKGAEDLAALLEERAFDIYRRKEQALGAPLMRELERVSMLHTVDVYWMDHIDAMDELRRGIGLQAYAQTDPVVEYTRVGYEMFSEMNERIREETVRMIFTRQVRTQSIAREKVAKITGTSGGTDGTVRRQPVKKAQKVGRNDPCPCGSGKKYKQCCLRRDEQAAMGKTDAP